MNRPKQFIAKERELENSQLPEILSAKKIQTLKKFIPEKDHFVSSSYQILCRVPIIKETFVMQLLQVSNARECHKWQFVGVLLNFYIKVR